MINVALDAEFADAVNAVEFGHDAGPIAEMLRSDRPLSAAERARLADAIAALASRPIQREGRGAPAFGPGATHRAAVVDEYNRLRESGFVEKDAAYQAGKGAVDPLTRKSRPVTERTVRAWAKDLRDRDLQIKAINLQR